MDSKEAQQTTDEVLAELQSATKEALTSCNGSVIEIKVDLASIESMLEIEYPKKDGSGLVFELQEIEERIAVIYGVLVAMDIDL